MAWPINSSKPTIEHSHGFPTCSDSTFLFPPAESQPIVTVPTNHMEPRASASPGCATAIIPYACFTSYPSPQYLELPVTGASPAFQEHLAGSVGSPTRYAVHLQNQTDPNWIPATNDMASQGHIVAKPTQVPNPQGAPTFQCKWQGCRSSTRFNREYDLIRHIRTIHISPGAYPCFECNCGKAFGRKDHLREHQRRRHSPGSSSS